MIGRFATGSIGFGWLAVIGRSRVPSPPAITTAFTAGHPPCLPPALSREPLPRADGPPDPPPDPPARGAAPAPPTARPRTSTAPFPRWHTPTRPLWRPPRSS